MSASIDLEEPSALQVFDHPANSPVLQKALRSALPYSISLVHRTQHQNQTPHAYILATFPPTPDKLADDAVSSVRQFPDCWAVAYLDRSKRPETELWLFAAGEIPGHITSSSSPASTSSSSTFCETCVRAIFSLLRHMATLPIPPLSPPHDDHLDAAEAKERETPDSKPGIRLYPSHNSNLQHLLFPSVLTLGGCSQQIVQICAEAGLVRADFPGPDKLLNKWFFQVDRVPSTKDLPKGLKWGRVKEEDLAIVQARTWIPRSKWTLMSLESVGAFDEETDTMVAWAFLGLDGSLTTLHTEPAYRGKGIAKAVATRLMKGEAARVAFDNRGIAWAHADVYIDNVQSEGVCRSLGGSPMAKILWVRIDLDSIASAVR